MAAITERKVRYWKTRKKPHSGFMSCSHSARLSSMLTSGQLGDDGFHLHESGSFDQDGSGLGRAIRGVVLGVVVQGRDDLGGRFEMTRLRPEGLRGVAAQGARRPQPLDALRSGMGA